MKNMLQKNVGLKKTFNNVKVSDALNVLIEKEYQKLSGSFQASIDLKY